MAVFLLAAVAKTEDSYALAWVGLLQQVFVVCVDCALDIGHTAIR